MIKAMIFRLSVSYVGVKSIGIEFILFPDFV